MNERWIFAQLTPNDIECTMESFQLEPRKIVLDGVLDIGEMACDSHNLNPEFCRPRDESGNTFDGNSLTFCSDVYLDVNPKRRTGLFSIIRGPLQRHLG